MQISEQAMTSSGSPVTGAELSPSVQLLSATSNPSSASSSAPWMVTSYPMMVLQQGIPQSLFAQSVLAFPEGGQVVLAPVDESAAGQQLTTDAGSGGGIVQLSKSAKPQDQWLSSTAASTASAGHSVVKGAPEARGAKQDVAGAGGMTQQVRNGSVQVLVPQSGSQQLLTARAELPVQPKKPLTPYMLFSKSIWPHVKAANSHLSSVCEIGAIVGSLWRDMDPKEKQRYNDLFARDKERYENELRTYLKTTGLNASDLAKQPKPKRNRDKPPTSWPSFSSTSSAPQGTQAAAATSNAAAAQDGQQASADILPTFSQGAWTGQMTPQLAAQQVLTQLGLSGQTLFANSDGSICVGGNNISNLLSLPSQSLQLVSMTGEPVATIYSNTGQSGMSQIGVVTTSSDTPGGMDGTRPSWVWQQQQPALSVMAGQDGADGGAGASMVLYHLPASTADSLGKVVELKNQLDQAALGDSSSSVRSLIPSVHHPAQQYSVDQLGQLVVGGDGTNGGLSREAKLEAELQQMSCALLEKAQEVSDLTDKLRQAYELIERYKELSGESVPPDAPKSDATDPPSQDAGSCLDETVDDERNQNSVAEN